MYASTSASDDDQIWCSARPRPGRSRWTARTSGNLASSAQASGQVPSVLPLSAIVTRAVNGKALAQVPDEPRDARREVVLFVLDRNDDIYLRCLTHGPECANRDWAAAAPNLHAAYE